MSSSPTASQPEPVEVTPFIRIVRPAAGARAAPPEAAVHARPSFENQLAASEPVLPTVMSPTARTPAGVAARPWISAPAPSGSCRFQAIPSVESTKTASPLARTPAATKRVPVQTTLVSWVSLEAG